MTMTWIGIDPGIYGAIGVLDAEGRMTCVWDMPRHGRARRKRDEKIDLGQLSAILQWLSMQPAPLVRCEWPHTRPGEDAESSRNFGLGLGYLEGLCQGYGLSLDKVAPGQWKGRLGLPGKMQDSQAKKKACERAAYWIEGVEREHVFGPRGGGKDGRAEALLIAWEGWSRTYHGMHRIRDRFGAGSAQAQAFCMMGGKRGRKPAQGGMGP